MTDGPDYEYDGVGIFEAPVFDIEVDPTSKQRPPTIRLAASGQRWELAGGAADARRLAEILTRVADWAENPTPDAAPEVTVGSHWRTRNGKTATVLELGRYYNGRKKVTYHVGGTVAKRSAATSWFLERMEPIE